MNDDAEQDDPEVAEAMSALVQAAASDDSPIELAAITELPGRVRRRLGKRAKNDALELKAANPGLTNRQIATTVADQIVEQARNKGDQYNSILLLIGGAALSAIIQFLVLRFLERRTKPKP